MTNVEAHTTPPVVSFSRRRRPWRDASDDGRHWGPKWRRLVMSPCGSGNAGPPSDFSEFDRVVRGMLNRISSENARWLLPLEPVLRGAGPASASDCPAWWAARCAALMLNHYLQVIHTNRCARGLAMRSNDNVLPEYLDAVGPLLARSPELVKKLVAWVARLLNWQDLCWPVTRLLLLAAREPRERSALPPHSLGRLPPEVVRKRILAFLVPPALPKSAAAQDPGVPAMLCACWGDVDGKKDVVAVLAHLLLFTPEAAWSQLAASAFAMAEVALQGPAGAEEEKVYLAAAVVVSIAQRLEKSVDSCAHLPRDVERLPETIDEPQQAEASAWRQDFVCLMRLEELLVSTAAISRSKSKLSIFVDSRVLAASDHTRRVYERFASASESRSMVWNIPDPCLAVTA